MIGRECLPRQLLSLGDQPTYPGGAGPQWRQMTSLGVAAGRAIIPRTAAVPFVHGAMNRMCMEEYIVNALDGVFYGRGGDEKTTVCV